MSTNKEMQAVAEMLYREGWNAAINAAIKVVHTRVGSGTLADIRELKK